MALQDVIRYVSEPATGAALNLYCVIFNANGSGTAQVYKNSGAGSGVFVTCSEGSWADYAIAMAESCNSVYSVALPVNLQGPCRVYDIAIYERTGGTAAIDVDTLLGTQTHVTGNLNVQVLPSVPSTCVETAGSVRILFSCESEDGPLQPASTAVAVVGSGSASIAAVSGHSSLYQATFTAAGAAGTEATLVATFTFGFPSIAQNAVSLIKKVGVPIKVCETSSGGGGGDCPTASEIAIEVNSVLSTNHGSGSWLTGGGAGGSSLEITYS